MPQAVIPPPKMAFHDRFFCCSVCKCRPADRMCCRTWQSFCAVHAKEYYEENKKKAGVISKLKMSSSVVPHIFTNYEIWQYEECFWCYDCEGYVMCESFDSILEPLFVSKGGFVHDPVTDKHLDYFERTRYGSQGPYTIRVGTGTMQGWRSDNEDSHVVSLGLEHHTSVHHPSMTQLDYCAVFDGHGGPLVARYAGNNVHKIITTHIGEGLQKTKHMTDTAMTTILSKSFLQLDAVLQSETTSDESGSTGCTANVVLIDHLNKKIYCANAGDARAILCRRKTLSPGKYQYRAIDLSHDHRPLLQSESQRIRAAGSTISGDDRVEGLLAVSRAFGDFDFKQASSLPPEKQAVTCSPEVSINPILCRNGAAEPTEEDVFILSGCDGIWDCLTSEACCTFIVDEISKQLQTSSTVNPSDIVGALLDRCVARVIPEDGIGTDNMSCVLMLLVPCETIKV